MLLAIGGSESLALGLTSFLVNNNMPVLPNAPACSTALPAQPHVTGAGEADVEAALIEDNAGAGVFVFLKYALI